MSEGSRRCPRCKRKMEKWQIFNRSYICNNDKCEINWVIYKEEK